MAYPNKALQLFSFTGFSNTSPTSQQPGSSLDQEFNEARRAVTEIVAYLEASRLDSLGNIKPLAVNLDQLDPELAEAIFGTATPDWTAYENQIVAARDAAQAAQTAAATAQTGAQTAETGAVAAQTAAESARDAAQAAAGGFVEHFKTTAEAQAATIDVNFQHVLLLEPRSWYTRVSAEPVHTYKFRSADRHMPDGSTNATNGGWWELNHDDLIFSRRVNAVADNPTVPNGVYTVLAQAPMDHRFWINQWGYQEVDGSGNLIGNVGGTLARTQAAQLYLQASHSGEGDAYAQYSTMAVSQHGRTGIVTAWGGQNSGGLFNGQANAATAQVNLFGFGDVVLSDQGFADVGMLGVVMILDRSGADAAAYKVPRFNFMAQSRGTFDIDAAYIAKGKFFAGLDFSDAAISSNFAIAMKAGQRIGFDATVPPIGKFSTQAPGGYWIEKSGSFLSFVVANASRLALYSDRLEVRPGADGQLSHRVFGLSATAFAALGQVGATSYLSAASTATDNTILSIRTANAGTEADRLVVESAGHTRPGVNNTLNLGTATFLWANVYASAYRDANANQVVGPRRTGWFAPTGTAVRAAYATFAGQVITNPPTQAEVQAIDDHVVILSQRLKALIDDLTNHGLIGA